MSPSSFIMPFLLSFGIANPPTIPVASSNSVIKYCLIPPWTSTSYSLLNLVASTRYSSGTCLPRLTSLLCAADETGEGEEEEREKWSSGMRRNIVPRRWGDW